jgi:hypothetical protein
MAIPSVKVKRQRPYPANAWGPSTFSLVLDGGRLLRVRSRDTLPKPDLSLRGPDTQGLEGAEHAAPQHLLQRTAIGSGRDRS